MIPQKPNSHFFDLFLSASAEKTPTNVSIHNRIRIKTYTKVRGIYFHKS